MTAFGVEEVAYGDALDRAFSTDRCVDTTGLTVAEVVERVRARTGWLNLAASVEKPSPTRPVPDPTPGEILWLCGPAAVGKSTVGWQVAVGPLDRPEDAAAYTDALPAARSRCAGCTPAGRYWPTGSRAAAEIPHRRGAWPATS